VGALEVVAGLNNPPPGTYWIMQTDPQRVEIWRNAYGSNRIRIASRDIMVFRDVSRGSEGCVYLAPLSQLHGEPRTQLERWYSRLRLSTRNALEQEAGEPVIPIPIDGTMVWREEDEQEPAWPGETVHHGRVERGSIDHFGTVG